MASWNQYSLVFVLQFVLFTLISAQCDIPPLQIGWSNTTVSANGLGVTRGMEIGIGTPNQIFAFRPATTLNNTRVNNVLGCVSSANASCVGGVGGVFDPSESPTYTVSIKAQWNGSQIDDESSTGSYVYFNDVVDFQTDGHVDGFPLVMDSEPGGGPQSSLPLGTNSSFLRAAVAGAVAPSIAWGLWPGSRSLAPVDGLLVIGGYDKSRVNGSFTNFTVADWSLASACPLQVTVLGLEYGGQSLFANDSETMVACIEPETRRFVFPPDIATQFGALTGQNSTAYPKGMNYNASTSPTGNLTITLDNGYKSTISNSEMFSYLRGSDGNGRYAIINNTVVEASIADTRTQDPSTIFPILGNLFLTFNYLVVDYSVGEFRLAPAVPSEKQVGSPRVDTICTPTVAPNKPSSSATSIPKKKKSSSKAGPIAGGVVGGLVGLTLLGALLFFLFTRYRRRHIAESRDLSHPSEPPIPPPAYSHTAELPEQTEKSIYEMPGKKSQSLENVTVSPLPETDRSAGTLSRVPSFSSPVSRGNQ